MAQAKGVSPQDSKARSSHRALVNQALKPPISSEPPASLPNWSDREFSNDTAVELPAWDMRRLFNHLDLVRLARKHGYEVGYVYWGPIGRAATQGLGSNHASVRLRFDAPDGTVAFDAHCYPTHSARSIRIAATGKLDPKFIVMM